MRKRLAQRFAAAILALVLVAMGADSASAQKAPPPQGFEQTAADAKRAADQDRFDDAIRLYRRALALRPKWSEGWWSLGTILYDRNDFGAAAGAFQRLVALAPGNGTAHLMLGLCEFELGSDNSSLEQILAARELGVLDNPQLRGVMLFHLGLLYLRKNQFENALEALASLSKQGTKSSELSLALGMGVLRMHPTQLPPAGTTDREVVERLGQAQALAIDKKFDASRGAYASLVAEYPKFQNIHYAFGRYLLETHDVDEAIVQFQEELKNSPQNVYAMLQIAAARYRLDSTAGLPFAEQAVKLNSRIPFGHYLFGLLLLDTDDPVRAIPELEIAKQAFPNEAKVYFALGSAYAKVGRKQEAAKAREEFARLNQQQQQDSMGARVHGETPGIGQQDLRTDTGRPQN